MKRSEGSMAQQIAEAAVASEKRRTGHTPESVTVVLSDTILMITLHGALSPAELVLARSPEGAAKIQELHRHLFECSADALRQEINRITGVEIREVAAQVEAATGTIIHAFKSGTIVQLFLLAKNVPPESWSGSGLPE